MAAVRTKSPKAKKSVSGIKVKDLVIVAGKPGRFAVTSVSKDGKLARLVDPKRSSIFDVRYVDELVVVGQVEELPSVKSNLPVEIPAAAEPVTAVAT